MKTLFGFTSALSLLLALGATPALANSCQTEHMMCPTSMPIDGYCECTAHGNTEGGTVIPARVPRQHTNAAPAGCGAHPNDAGCR